MEINKKDVLQKIIFGLGVPRTRIECFKYIGLYFGLAGMYQILIYPLQHPSVTIFGWFGFLYLNVWMFWDCKYIKEKYFHISINKIKRRWNMKANQKAFEMEYRSIVEDNNALLGAFIGIVLLVLVASVVIGIVANQTAVAEANADTDDKTDAMIDLWPFGVGAMVLFAIFSKFT